MGGAARPASGLPWQVAPRAGAAHMSLDQIAVYAVQQAPAVPEPQTWALMGAGLGAMALVRRRRQARSATAPAPKDTGRRNAACDRHALQSPPFPAPAPVGGRRQ